MTKVHLPVMDHAPWSPSKADKALRCGHAFHLRYVEKIKEAQGTHARIGVCVHRAQELIVEGTEAKIALQLAMEEQDDLTHEEKVKVSSFLDAMISFGKKLQAFVHKHNVVEILLEKQWAVTEDFEPCDFFDDRAMIRGIVDLAMVTKAGYLVVIDHKSGKKKPISKFGPQLDIYTVMAQAYYPTCKGVQPAIHFVGREEIVWETMRKPDHIKEVLQPWMKKHLGKANALAFSPTPSTGWWCNWCDYKPQCPAWNTNDPR